MTSATRASSSAKSNALPPEPASKSTTSKNWFSSRMTAIALLAAVGIAAYLVTRYFLHLPLSECRWILIAVLVAGGGPLVIDLARKAFAGEFGSDLLAGISIVTSAVLGE